MASDDDIEELRAAVADLRRELRATSEATHATLHLLAYLYTTRCLSDPDPVAAYKEVATVLLGSLGATGDAALPVYGDEARDAVARGLRHHVGQFLLTLQAHVEANMAAAGEAGA